MEILLVGTVHLGYTPDINQLSEEDKRKFGETHFEQLTNDLASFKAEQIFVEYPFTLQEQLHHAYESNDVTDEFKQNEIYQIAFRLAKKMGHDSVYAVDWNEEVPGLIDLGELANGPSKEEFQQIMSRAAAMMESENTWIQQGDIIQLFKSLNTKENNKLGHQIYIDMMGFSDDRAFDWVVNYWYYRNLKIVQNIKKSLKANTKRAIVLCGAGHNYLVGQQLEDHVDITVINYGDL